MENDHRIQIGDTVKVYFSVGDGSQPLYGKVHSMPQATGDAWIIEDEDGTTTYVQNYAKIVRFYR